MRRGRHARRRIGALGLVVVLGVACAAPNTQRAEIATGSRAEVTDDGLHRLVNAGFREAWAKPDADLARYDKVALRFVTLRYKRKPSARRQAGYGTEGNFALTQAQVDRVAKAFAEIFEAELMKSTGFTLVDEPGPDVLYIEASIVDLVVNVPTESYSGRDVVLTTSTADMTLVLELFDSETGELLARVKERKEARLAGRSGINDLYQSNAVTNSDAVRRVFRRWSRILRERLDLVHSAAGGPAGASEPGAGA